MNRDLFFAPALEVAPQLLGSILTVYESAADDSWLDDHRFVSVRITEVEAYHGVGVPGPYDAGSHSRDRKTDRNASMFGPPGHAYVYLSYGMHFAINMVCSPEGTASGVLIRAGEVIAGDALALERRNRGRSARPIPHRQLARGPGNLASALGITRPQHDGRDLFSAPFRLAPATQAVTNVLAGPRVGVSGEAGGAAFPWRFWIDGDATVSTYRPGRNVTR